MDGWKTLITIHQIGLVFIGFWIVGTVRKEGLWGNLLLLFNWCIAIFATLRFFAPALKGVLSLAKPAPNAQLLVLALAMAVAWALFLVFFGIMKTATDSLSNVKVAFHPKLDAAGTFLCMAALIAGIRYSALPMELLLVLGKLVSPE